MSSALCLLFYKITERRINMPAAFSHWILGRRIINSPQFESEFPNINKNAFLWGCQGPDILFYHRLLPWQKNDSLKKLGSLLHKCNPLRLFNSLAKVCRYCLGSDSADVIYSYALGFCCHYCYDRKLHPLVYYNTALLEKIDERGSEYKYHTEIESNLDIILMRHELKRMTNEMSMRDCLPAFSGSDKAIAKLYALLLKDMYDIRISSVSAMTLAYDFKFNMGLLDDKYAVKKPMVSTAEKILPQLNEGSLSGLVHAVSEDISFDYANLLKNTWFNPDNRSFKSNMNIYEITDAAESDTWELIRLFADAVRDKDSVDFDKFTQNIDFNGCRYAILF